MSDTSSVKRAHLALLPEGTQCGPECAICQPGSDSEQSKEVARVSDEPKYTEAQHTALAADAVTRETAALTEAKDELTTQVASLTSEKQELETRVTTLEAEKAAEAIRADEAEQALVDYKDEVEAEKALEARKTERAAAVLTAAPHLGEDYVADATRQATWAGMSDEAFASLVDGLTETAAKLPGKFVDGKFVADADKGSGKEKAGDTTQQARETAAFKGGAAVTGDEDESKGSTLGRFFSATGKVPAASTSA